MGINAEGPIHSGYRETMKAVAEVIDGAFNENPRDRKTGFVLFVFDCGKPFIQRMNYISNTSRPETLAALRDYLDKAEAGANDSTVPAPSSQ